MKILVTGIAGLLGANIAYLLRDKYDIFGVDTNDFLMRGVKSFNVSAFDVEEIEQIIINYKIDALIHCAALVNVDACEENPRFANVSNVLMTKNLCYLCKRYQIKLVFLSSDAIYSGKKRGLNSELDVPVPISVYGKTKFQAEKIALQNDRTLIIRTNMYGFNFREKKSFGEWVISELMLGKTLQMFYDVKFSPILVNRLVKILDLCLSRDLSGIYNVGCTSSVTKYDLGVLLKQEFDLGGYIQPYSMYDFNFKAPRTENMGLDNQKIKETLNIEIPSFKEDVKMFKELYHRGYRHALKSGN